MCTTCLLQSPKEDLSPSHREGLQSGTGWSQHGKGRAGFISQPLSKGHGEDDHISAQSCTHHKGVIGELVPVEEVLEEVGTLVAGVPPGHG